MGNTYITSDEGKHGKNHQRNGHDFGGFMDMMCYMLIDPGLTKKSHEQSPEHIKGRHSGSHGSHPPQDEMAMGAGKGLPENFLFAEESGKARNPGNGQRGDEEGP